MTLDVRKKSQQKQCQRTRVWLDGVDVTSRCFYADDSAGIVRLYRLNAEGKKYVEHAQFEHWDVPPHLRPRVATEEMRGHVRFEAIDA